MRACSPYALYTSQLLWIFFTDVRREDPVPQRAGASSRTDFVLKKEEIIVEVKKTRPNLGDNEVGKEIIPHSQWLEHLNRTEMDRFEMIAIRVPVKSSHLHKPFSDAVTKIREAERQYSRREWNAAASSCRSAWRTILSTAPSGTSPFEYLLAPVASDPKRKDFAAALIKGLNDIENKAVHLEGNVNTGTLPADLKPEDALLCIHWYAAVIGYLSSL